MPRRKAGGLIPQLVWVVLACVVIAPIMIAAASPLLAGRDIAYIISGIAGASALVLLLLQPLLAAAYLPGLRKMQQRRWHRWIGSCLIAAVALHIGGLYVTSPPDTIDALLLLSPTWFSVYGVIALWGLIFTVLLVVLRARTGLRYRTWRVLHNALVLVVVVASVVHALMIEGTMGNRSKWMLCVAVLLAIALVTLHLRVVKPMQKRRQAAAQSSASSKP